MTENETGTAYTMGRSAAETERLIEQSHLYERVTLRMLRNAGVDTGMKVLDIGSGAGDVAMAAAQLVGPGGSVVGVDLNPDILETARTRVREAGHHNIAFIAGDAREVELPDDFDALIGRLVLMYLPIRRRRCGNWLPTCGRAASSPSRRRNWCCTNRCGRRRRRS